MPRCSMAAVAKNASEKTSGGCWVGTHSVLRRRVLETLIRDFNNGPGLGDGSVIYRCLPMPLRFMDAIKNVTRTRVVPHSAPGHSTCLSDVAQCRNRPIGLRRGIPPAIDRTTDARTQEL
jgi:hypothetical protein